MNKAKIMLKNYTHHNTESSLTKTIVFADLDDTLFRSYRKLTSDFQNNGINTDISTLPVGAYNKKNLPEKNSHLEPFRMKMVDWIVGKADLFIPTTMRTLQQFDRINFELFNFTNLKYIITDNGKYIHIINKTTGTVGNSVTDRNTSQEDKNKYELLSDWANMMNTGFFDNPNNPSLSDTALFIKEQSKQNKMFHNDHFTVFNTEQLITYKNDWESTLLHSFFKNIQFNLNENIVLNGYIDGKVTNNDIVPQEVHDYMFELGFYVYQSYDRIAFVPYYQRKEYAVYYLMKMLNINSYHDLVIGLGDNDIDVNFMNLCSFAMIPQNSNLLK